MKSVSRDSAAVPPSSLPSVAPPAASGFPQCAAMPAEAPAPTPEEMQNYVANNADAGLAFLIEDVKLQIEEQSDIVKAGWMSLRLSHVKEVTVVKREKQTTVNDERVSCRSTCRRARRRV